MNTQQDWRERFYKFHREIIHYEYHTPDAAVWARKQIESFIAETLQAEWKRLREGLRSARGRATQGKPHNRSWNEGANAMLNSVLRLLDRQEGDVTK